jgi:hypothetical protein
MLKLKSLPKKSKCSIPFRTKKKQKKRSASTGCEPGTVVVLFFLLLYGDAGFNQYAKRVFDSCDTFSILVIQEVFDHQHCNISAARKTGKKQSLSALKQDLKPILLAASASSSSSSVRSVALSLPDDFRTSFSLSK